MCQFLPWLVTNCLCLGNVTKMWKISPKPKVMSLKMLLLFSFLNKPSKNPDALHILSLMTKTKSSKSLPANICHFWFSFNWLIVAALSATWFSEQTVRERTCSVEQQEPVALFHRALQQKKENHNLCNEKASVTKIFKQISGVQFHQAIVTWTIKPLAGELNS